MIINPVLFSEGGGGAELNIVSYDSAFPESAAEDTIGVLTNTPISGYIASATEPTEGLYEGLVWIRLSKDSPAPITLGSITIYPVSAKQYNSGSFVSFPSENVRVYKSGWKLLRKYIFDSGDVCGNDFIRQGSGGSMVIGDGKMRIVGTARGGTTNTFSVGEHTKLCFEYNWVSGSSSVHRTIGLNNNYDISLTDPDYFVTLDNTAGYHSSSLDISNISGGIFYLKFWFASGATVDFYKIYLEG